jgi:hypothetical protein
MAYIKLKVSNGNYCWKFIPTTECPGPCDYFDNEGGHGRCELFKTSLKTSEGGYLKCSYCEKATIL